jgi:hypothetical protein
MLTQGNGSRVPHRFKFYLKRNHRLPYYKQNYRRALDSAGDRQPGGRKRQSMRSFGRGIHKRNGSINTNKPDKQIWIDALAFYAFPQLDARKISSSNMLERLNEEIRRRTSVVGIFSNEDAYIRLVTIYLMEYAEDWSVSRAYLRENSI